MCVKGHPELAGVGVEYSPGVRLNRSSGVMLMKGLPLICRRTLSLASAGWTSWKSEWAFPSGDVFER
eukprot:1327783-Prymnesium_polylepis.1